VEAFRVLLTGLAELDCDVLATVGRDLDPASLGPIPANARVEQFVPQAEILPSCRAVVCHGGSGSTLGALSHGLPLLLVPRGADQFDNAAACAAAGVARVLLPPEVTPERVAGDAAAVLGDPALAARAREIAAEIAAMPDPSAVAARLLAGAA
jgi:MGT family glycosyltransferase